jgi:hypothetical protein
VQQWDFCTPPPGDLRVETGRQHTRWLQRTKYCASGILGRRVKAGNSAVSQLKASHSPRLRSALSAISRIASIPHLSRCATGREEERGGGVSVCMQFGCCLVDKDLLALGNGLCVRCYLTFSRSRI